MKMVLRVAFYILGLFVLALGVTFAVNSNLGISPVSSVPYAISQVLQHHGIGNLTFGNCTTLVFCFYVLLQVVLLRRQFKIINLAQILVSTLFGWFVDLTKLILGDFAIPTYAGRLVMLCISILLIALGILLYLAPKLVPMPGEGLGLAVTQKLGKYPYHTVKMVLDCVFVVLAIVISLLGAGKVLGVREGTVVTALLVGRLMGILGRGVTPFVQRLCGLPVAPPPQKKRKAAAGAAPGESAAEEMAGEDG